MVPSQACEVQPRMRSLSSWWYPWDAMKQGDVFFVPDARFEARQRLAAAASAAAKRLDIKLATGPTHGPDGQVDGWWCARYDGCQLVDPPMSDEDKRLADDIERERWAAERAKMKRKADRRPAATEPVGTFAPEIAPELEVGDYSGWDSPVKPGEEF